MRAFRPVGLPLDAALFSSEDIGCAVSVYSLSDEFSSYALEGGAKFLDGATSERLGPEDKDGAREYGRWQETPLIDKFPDTSFESGQITFASDCLRLSPYFNAYNEIAYKSSGAYFTVSKRNNFAIVIPAKKIAYILRYRS